MQTRREKLRAASKDEIKTLARQQMAAEGTAGISLRGIARDMGMTAPAIYRYFPSRDDLITELIVDAFNAQSDAIAAADAPLPRAAYGDRVTAMMLAYREWAVAHVVDFQLIYGNPIPGYEAPREVTVPAASRVFTPLITALTEAYAAGVLHPPVEFLHLPATVEAHLRAFVETQGYPVPPEVFAVGVHGWNLIHGMVWLEIFGHTPPLIGDSAAFYRHQTLALCRSMSLTVGDL
ncbi:MAG: TetR/AcrR family transcriptional regulator [Chloroflexi bacterium]|nr:TetR/AcrR family transcriptional regulator [Chloroflexota bacterium]